MRRWAVRHGGFDPRFDPDDGHLWPQAAQVLNRGRRGGVAGHDDGLRALREQKARDVFAARGDVGDVALAVGSVAGIGDVEQIGLWHFAPQRLQDGQAAQPRVEDAQAGGGGLFSAGRTRQGRGNW